MSHVVDLPRGAAGFYILEMLGLAGWSVSVVAAGSERVLVTARLGLHCVERVGASSADVALEVFEEARAISRAGR